jgi:hypothetical protein
MTTIPTTAPSAQARFLHLLKRDLASTEAANCHYHLHTFFARYWEDGDFIPRAREHAEVEKDSAKGGAAR